MMEKRESQAGGNPHKPNPTMPSAEVDRNHFPSRLHQMISSLENSPDGLGGVVTWAPHGKCFMIRDNDLFINQVLPKWFCRLKFTSFQRQLCLFGFRKLGKKGPDQGGYYHFSFIRGQLDLATTIQPAKIKGKRGRRPKSDESEPNFYQTSPSQAQRPAEGPEVPPLSSKSATATPAARKASKPETGGRAVQDALFSPSPKEDSPDQLSLEAIIQQPQYRDEAYDSRQTGILPRLGDSGWPAVPTQQSLVAESRPITTAQRMALEEELNLQELMFPQVTANVTENSAAAAIQRTAAARRMSDFSMSDVAPTWGWESFSGVGVEEAPAVAAASLDQAPAPALAMGSALPTGYSQLQAQLPEDEHTQLQQILERQRLRDLMDLNQAQQKNLMIQQEQLEQQRLELQLRDQEQLQQLRMELQAREEQQQLQGMARMVEPLARAPRLFEPQRGGRLAAFAQGQRKPQATQRQQQQQQQQQPQGPAATFPGLFQQPPPQGR